MGFIWVTYLIIEKFFFVSCQTSGFWSKRNIHGVQRYFWAKFKWVGPIAMVSHQMLVFWKIGSKEWRSLIWVLQNGGKPELFFSVTRLNSIFWMITFFGEFLWKNFFINRTQIFSKFSNVAFGPLKYFWKNTGQVLRTKIIEYFIFGNFSLVPLVVKVKLSMYCDENNWQSSLTIIKRSVYS